ncbi:MAG: 3-deoxy-D-manno-octulosonic acid transferase [Rubricella sp.]
MSPLLLAYAFVSWCLQPFAPILLRRRAGRGKEDPERLVEKLGEATVERPDGELFWFHAASVGEALSLVQTVRMLRSARPEAAVLVTTGTVTSARLVRERMKDGIIHQFAPLDLPGARRRFLDHWHPDVAIFAESELWPGLLAAIASRGVPLVLLNARLSLRSYRRWRWAPFAVASILRRFSLILAQDEATAGRLRRLGASRRALVVTGTLKEGAAPLPHDETERRRLAAKIGGRPVWCAASTHEGEEEQIAAAHRAARRALPDLLLILVPRHPERGAEIGKTLVRDGWRLARRAAGDNLDEGTEIYLADTLGELGLWYRLASVSFVGGSLVPVGGHNPFEPAALGSAILTGPHVENFGDAFERLGTAGASRTVSSSAELGATLPEILRPDRAAAMATAAWEVSSAGSETADRVLALLLELRDGARP